MTSQTNLGEVRSHLKCLTIERSRSSTFTRSDVDRSTTSARVVVSYGSDNVCGEVRVTQTNRSESESITNLRSCAQTSNLEQNVLLTRDGIAGGLDLESTSSSSANRVALNKLTRSKDGSTNTNGTVSTIGVTETRVVLEVDLLTRLLIVSKNSTSTRLCTTHRGTNRKCTCYLTNNDLQFVTEENTISSNLKGRESNSDSTVITVGVVTRQRSDLRTVVGNITEGTIVCEGRNNLRESIVFQEESYTIRVNVGKGVEDHRLTTSTLTIWFCFGFVLTTLNEYTNSTTVTSAICSHVGEGSTVLNVRRPLKNRSLRVKSEVDTTCSGTDTSLDLPQISIERIVNIISKSFQTTQCNCLNCSRVRDEEHRLTRVRSYTVSGKTRSRLNCCTSQNITSNGEVLRENDRKLLRECTSRQFQDNRRCIRYSTTRDISVSDGRRTDIGCEGSRINDTCYLKVESLCTIREDSSGNTSMCRSTGESNTRESNISSFKETVTSICGNSRNTTCFVVCESCYINSLISSSRCIRDRSPCRVRSQTYSTVATLLSINIVNLSTNTRILPLNLVSRGYLQEGALSTNTLSGRTSCVSGKDVPLSSQQCCTITDSKCLPLSNISSRSYIDVSRCNRDVCRGRVLNQITNFVVGRCTKRTIPGCTTSQQRPSINTSVYCGLTRTSWSGERRNGSVINGICVTTEDNDLTFLIL